MVDDTHDTTQHIQLHTTHSNTHDTRTLTTQTHPNTHNTSRLTAHFRRQRHCDAEWLLQRRVLPVRRLRHRHGQVQEVRAAPFAVVLCGGVCVFCVCYVYVVLCYAACSECLCVCGY